MSSDISLKKIAAKRIIQMLIENTKESKDPLKALIDEIDSCVIIPQDLKSYLKDEIPSEFVYEAFELGTDEESFIKNFPKLADTIKFAIKWFRGINVSYVEGENIEKIISLEKTLKDKYQLISQLILLKVNNSDATDEDFKQALIWAINNNFDKLTKQILNIIPYEKRCEIETWDYRFTSQS